jgi:7-carboxy-7-deazaguanine synthase
MAETLKVNEIILTIQGEGTRAGLPCTLVRLSGCNLRCRWCDTRHAWTEGREMPLEDVLKEVRRLACRRVELTGGEPLLQKGAAELLARLCDGGREALVETNGAVDIAGLDARVIRVMDVKCPSSGESAATRWENLAALRPRDEVKFVLAGREDYDYARDVIARHDLCRRCVVLLSPRASCEVGPAAGGGEGPPLFAGLAPALLAEWILRDGLDVRLNLQLHKIIWPHKDKGV